jgi:nucleotide-binding universal stress UspA family protein
MAWTDVLVHIEHPASSTARLAVAVGLAKGHRARLTGLLVIRHLYPAAEEVAASREMFERQVAQAGIEGEWRCIDGSEIGAGMTDIIISHAHCSDLLVVGQASPESASGGIPFDLQERVVLETGRPVLVVPYAGAFATVGERVLVAWKAGRESTRAVNDALPILEKAQRVDILAKNDAEPFGEDSESLCASICEHLARHGVTARANEGMVPNIPVGDTLLNRVCDEGFDLLVMGALAHGLEGKLTLGSVARHLLREMTVPVLMSH